MDLQCPCCGIELEVEQMRIAARIQCPACSALFRADEGAPRFNPGAGKVIDVCAEVLSQERDTDSSKTDAETVAIKPVQTAGDEYHSGDISDEPGVYANWLMIRRRNNGCGCGGCGCLALLFLLLFLLLGCAATAIMQQ